MADVSRQNDFVTRGRALFGALTSIMGEARAFVDDYNAVGADAPFLQAGWQAGQGGTNVDAPLRPITKAEFIAAVGALQAVMATYDSGGNDTTLVLAKG
jgi:hypothetical protein